MEAKLLPNLYHRNCILILVDYIHSMIKHRKSNFRCFAFFKPYGVLSQFTSEEGKETLADYGPFPKDVYPVGRLDRDSEGLLLLTNDNELKHHLLEPRFAHPRTYLVQVEGIPDEQQIGVLKSGVVIEGVKTREAKVKLLHTEPELPARPVPIRFRKTIPTSWIEMTLTEGRNRQVRKMTAAVGFPTLRLIRIRIGRLTLEGLAPGGYKELTQNEIESLLL